MFGKMYRVNEDTYFSREKVVGVRALIVPMVIDRNKRIAKSLLGKGSRKIDGVRKERSKRKL